jgi:hypothetical protein
MHAAVAECSCAHYVGIPGPHATEGTREKGMYGNTALHLAAASPQMEIRKQLMELCPESKKALSDDVDPLSSAA